MNQETELHEIPLQNKLVPELINEIIDKALNSILDISQFEYGLKYDPSLNPEEPYMKRKLSQIRSDVLNSFGSSSLELKKSYSKIELEKMVLKNRLDQEQKSKEELELKTSKFSKNSATSNNFMSDAKIHKSNLEKEREYSIMMQNMIGNKRNSDGKFVASENNNKSNNKTDDWTSLMANSIKKKSRIEIEKEKFLEETKKRKEEQLKSITPLLKSQVFKFDENIIEKKYNENLKNENKIIFKDTQNADVQKTCQVCKNLIDCKSNLKRISNKCDHYLHYVKYDIN